MQSTFIYDIMRLPKRYISEHNIWVKGGVLINNEIWLSDSQYRIAMMAHDLPPTTPVAFLRGLTVTYNEINVTPEMLVDGFYQFEDWHRIIKVKTPRTYKVRFDFNIKDLEFTEEMLEYFKANRDKETI